MKAAVSHLEQFMEKADTAKPGEDCAGDGEGRCTRHRENLVEIILKNNGNDVVNLGIRCRRRVD